MLLSYKIIDGKAFKSSGFVVPEGFTEYVLGEEPKELLDILLSIAKTDKKQEIQRAFDVESNKPVDVNDILYNGGFDSALKLDGAKRMVEIAGLTEVTFYDVANKSNVLSIDGATNIILTIGAKYQVDFGKYQDLKVLIDSKLKVSTVESIVW